ncbi:uncharacterized protein KQ657_004725 [Scheffersomyces spartinae]|uniref:Co-chaperone HscB C-terminal oligomerisation domain-containing protein n=1 Tax=Scheffersomyces spartinae TaxID=45513 RepID=A0A9P7VB29_9ASCO|nr:uncharacterized protein KQ657_004725 [Scheffersomyces spartinae]KAG7194510.1 hypothetical protein KQ657_004725 [Scheffersomyces spartinae]
MAITTLPPSYFALFPKSFPKGGPPADGFSINERSLRREFRSIQSQSHPDIAANGDKDVSALINRAYQIIRNPYLRVAHFIQLNHPSKVDITEDDIAKKYIAEVQGTSPQASIAYKEMLMAVMEAHESLELANTESDLDQLSEENNERINQSETTINKLLAANPIDWDHLIMEAIALKYWVNISNAIRDWEPGKSIHLTH